MRDDAALRAQLERSRALGYLGPGAVDDHIRHADAFVAALADVDGTVVDLGAGGGVPGLVVAARRPDLQLILLDSMAKRCRFLRAAVTALDLRATVLEARAEDAGRGPLRGAVDAVLARSFGRPAVTAECGAPLLRIGGLLVVSEPPPGQMPLDRWPPDPLEHLGLRAIEPASRPVQVLQQVASCPERYPRRVGLPARRPLF